MAPYTDQVMRLFSSRFNSDLRNFLQFLELFKFVLYLVLLISLNNSNKDQLLIMRLVFRKIPYYMLHIYIIIFKLCYALCYNNE